MVRADRSPRPGPRRQRGAIAILAALLLPIAIVAAAFAIDLGHLFFVKRDMQKAADAAAQAAAQRPDDAQRTAQEVARLNGFDADAGVVTATLGRWDPAGPTQACPPWRTGGCTPPSYFASGLQPFNAAQVVLRRDVPLFFFAGARTIEVGAIAARVDAAGLSVGGRLASIDTEQSRLLNALLRGLLGTSLSIDAAGYRALADANVRLGPLKEALGVGNFEELLQAGLTLPVLYDGILTALGQDGVLDSAAGGALHLLLDAVSAPLRSVTVRLADILDLSLPTAQSATEARVNVFGLVTAAAMVANRGHFIEIPDLGLQVPGVLGIRAGLVVISPPSLAYGPPGQDAEGRWYTQARSAQIGLKLDVRVAPLLGDTVHLPLYLDVAAGQARLAELQCGVPRSATRAAIDANASLANVVVGDIDDDALSDTHRPLHERVRGATLLNVLGLIRVSVKDALVVPVGTGGASGGQQGWQRLEFTGAPPLMQTVDNNAVGSVLGTVVGALRDQLRPGNLNVVVLSESGLLGLVGGLVGGLVSGVVSGLLDLLLPLLTPLLQVLDAVLVPVLRLLGVQLGAADVGLDTVSCNQAGLVY
ncbi:putative membrane protein [Caldimonas thermodepolymerans]|uniref:Membrane protein n=1 Tax=Caldimonas thermodepolymerans TaxID=215580 RepID=A0AA46HW44_9BURK|nr:putative membrane protein [Caldimonas thermodepolymerans]TCP07712.1 putative membrane protein [Caldimonas thermodepolymerans]